MSLLWGVWAGHSFIGEGRGGRGGDDFTFLCAENARLR